MRIRVHCLRGGVRGAVGGKRHCRAHFVYPGGESGRGGGDLTNALRAVWEAPRETRAGSSQGETGTTLQAIGAEARARNPPREMHSLERLKEHGPATCPMPDPTPSGRRPENMSPCTMNPSNKTMKDIYSSWEMNSLRRAPPPPPGPRPTGTRKLKCNEERSILPLLMSRQAPPVRRPCR